MAKEVDEFWDPLMEMTRSQIREALETDTEMWGKAEQAIARLYLETNFGDVEVSPPAGNLVLSTSKPDVRVTSDGNARVVSSDSPETADTSQQSQIAALVELVRKVNRSAGGIARAPVPIEGEIAAIIGEDASDSGSTRLLAEDGSPLVTEAGDPIALEGEARFEGQSGMSAKGHVIQPTNLGPAYIVSDEEADPIRQAIAQVKSVLDGAIPEEEAFDRSNAKVLNLSRTELDALNEVVDFAVQSTLRPEWFQSTLNGLKLFKELTDQLTENMSSLSNLAEASTGLLKAMAAFVLAYGAFVILL